MHMTAVTISRQICLLIIMCLLLLACALEDKPIVNPIGDFRLGHVTVHAGSAETAQWSRRATETQLTDAVRTAVRTRFGPLRGRSWYHVAITLDAYLLPPPGIPVIASPRAGVVARVQIWDDRTRSVLNPRPRTIAANESTNSQTLFGSGYSYDAEDQLDRAARSLALQIEHWLRSEESPLPAHPAQHRTPEPDFPADDVL